MFPVYQQLQILELLELKDSKLQLVVPLIKGGVRQGNVIFSKLSTMALENGFEKLD